MSSPLKTTSTLGIALSGGGPRGIAHIGALAALAEEGITPHLLAGTSAGALVGALTAFGIPYDAQRAYAEQMKWRTITKMTISRFGLATNENIRRVITHFIGHKRIEDAHIPLAIIACDIETGEKVVLREGDVADAVMASACIPGAFTPVLLNGRLLVDGGLAENLPLSPLKEAHADILVGIDLMTRKIPRIPEGLLDVITNAFDIALYNTMVPKHPADLIIKPKFPSPIHIDPVGLRSLHDEGYRAAQSHVPALRDILRTPRTSSQ